MRQLVAILDSIRSLYNVGSIFRTADALGIEHLYLTGFTGTPADALNRERIHKTALGAETTVPWSYASDLATLTAQLKQDGFTIVALEQTPTAESFLTYSAPDKIALIVGHELYGVNESVLTHADHAIHIPMLGQKESLNVAVAFGITAAWLRWK